MPLGDRGGVEEGPKVHQKAVAARQLRCGGPTERTNPVQFPNINERVNSHLEREPILVDELMSMEEAVQKRTPR